MNKPYTKRQQESQQKYCPISPIEIQGLQQPMQDIPHVSAITEAAL